MSLSTDASPFARELDPTALAVEAPTTNELLKVSVNSRPSAVAGAIAGVIREGHSAEVQAIGAGATNQAVKAIAIACSYLRDDQIAIACTPGFIDVMIEGEKRTAMRLLVERRALV